MNTFEEKLPDPNIQEEQVKSRFRLAPDATYDVLVLDARARQSLVAIRSLGKRGLRVAAMETKSSVPAFSSRWCHKKIVCPVEEGTEAYLECLEQAIERTGVKVIIPSSDGTIALLRKYRERLERKVHIALAQEPGLEIAINKQLTLNVAHHLGLGVPQGMLVHNVHEVYSAIEKIGLPAVIKPTESWVSNGEQQRRIVSQLVVNAEEAQRTVADLTASGDTVLFQPFLSGRRESLTLFYAHGTIYARFAQLVERTDPPLGGTTVLRQSIPVPYDTGEQAECLIREINLEGFSEIEFRRDNAGKPYLMEINPRLCANIEIGVRAGVDFPSLLYRWANGESLEIIETYRTGGWMRYLWGDIVATIATIRERGRPGVASPVKAIFDFVRSFFIPMSYDYVDIEDIRPLFAAIMGRAGGLFQLINKGPSRKEKDVA